MEINRRHDFCTGAARACRPVKCQLCSLESEKYCRVIQCLVATFLNIIVEGGCSLQSDVEELF